MEIIKTQNGNRKTLPDENGRGNRRCPPSSNHASHADCSPCPIISNNFKNVNPENEGGIMLTRPGMPYLEAADVLDDYRLGCFFFVRGVEVNSRYIGTSTVKELLDLMDEYELRRSEVARG